MKDIVIGHLRRRPGTHGEKHHRSGTFVRYHDEEAVCGKRRKGRQRKIETNMFDGIARYRQIPNVKNKLDAFWAF
jgi:hypothetical protein